MDSNSIKHLPIFYNIYLTVMTFMALNIYVSKDSSKLEIYLSIKSNIILHNIFMLLAINLKNCHTISWDQVTIYFY